MQTMWMIYGANGYTGELIAREAVKRGERPILAGRTAGKVEPLARELGCEARVFDLEQPDLRDVDAVLHCAGPFSRTSKPMVDACLAAGAHYLDITGEIAVFEAVLGRHDEAVQRGVTLLPGVGFDVVPTDCLAAMLARKLPGADELDLAFWTRGGGLSPGTTKTSLEGLGSGGAMRRDGRIVQVPLLHDARDIPFSGGTRYAATIPWGDVSTAYHTTGIPNIRVYTARSKKDVTRIRRLRPLLRLVGIPFINRLLQKSAARRPGPDATRRADGRIYLWGRVAKRTGEEVTMTMECPEGYTFTVESSLRAVQKLRADAKRPGAFTPAVYFGEQFAQECGAVLA
ncbi:MAG TPA: saccharopine dehydrogenase NADP-binding domain-containing protein [Thermoanaerobaculia bacterium]|jgi:saccharopine dehydrogenase (NAD+, L-lysine-forming)